MALFRPNIMPQRTMRQPRSIAGPRTTPFQQPNLQQLLAQQGAAAQLQQQQFIQNLQLDQVYRQQLQSQIPFVQLTPAQRNQLYFLPKVANRLRNDAIRQENEANQLLKRANQLNPGVAVLAFPAEAILRDANQLIQRADITTNRAQAELDFITGLINQALVNLQNGVNQLVRQGNQVKLQNPQLGVQLHKQSDLLRLQGNRQIELFEKQRTRQMNQLREAIRRSNNTKAKANQAIQATNKAKQENDKFWNGFMKGFVQNNPVKPPEIKVAPVEPVRVEVVRANNQNNKNPIYNPKGFNEGFIHA